MAMGGVWGWLTLPPIAMGGLCSDYALMAYPKGFIRMTHDEIFGKVKEILVDALSVDDDQVTPTARLQGDLDAESIDFLDIVFRLEREFGLKIDRNELFPESIFAGDPKFLVNGKINEAGLAELREKMPYANLDQFSKNPEFAKIGDLFTVDLITKYIGSKLAGKA